jgi:hypothetical protein
VLALEGARRNASLFRPPQVTDADNALMPPQPLPGYGAPADINAYASAKEGFLGDTCSKPSLGPQAFNWSHWGIMFKSGNMDLSKGLCNSTGPGAAADPAATGSSERFNNHPMNQPLVVHFDSAAGWVRLVVVYQLGCATPEHTNTHPPLARTFYACTHTHSRSLPCPLPSPRSPTYTPTTPSRPVVMTVAPLLQPLPYTNATGVSGYFAGTYDVPLGANASVLAALSTALHQYTQTLYAFRLKELACPGGLWYEAQPPPPQPTRASV